MLLTYTEILGSELPIYTSLSANSDLLFREDLKSEEEYEIAGYYLYDTSRDLYKELYNIKQ